MIRNFFKLPSNAILYIPERFQKSEKTIANYKNLMRIYDNFNMNYLKILNLIQSFSSQTVDTILLKIKVTAIKKRITDCRYKYVVKSWWKHQITSLHNEMTTDISELLKEYSQIGVLLKKVKTLDKNERKDSVAVLS